MNTLRFQEFCLFLLVCLFCTENGNGSNDTFGDSDGIIDIELFNNGIEDVEFNGIFDDIDDVKFNGIFDNCVFDGFVFDS